MSAPLHDGDLVSSYLRDKTESAFRALVARHVDLVFATAMRQVGDRTLAEEIAQNVFIALARKAPRLAGYQTLAGWLHKTTLLEARARIRSELRRKAREQTAAELHSLAREGASPAETLVPLLDEALLSLRDTDRTALISRFFDNKSLRDVGLLLGVDEDAARKRVARALEKLTAFFRQRGIAVPAGTGVAGIFSAGAQTAPASLASALAHTSLAAAPSVPLFNLFFNLMALTKTKTVVISAALLSAPLLWQSKTQADLSASHRSLATRIHEQESILRNLSDRRDEFLLQARAEMNARFTAESQLATLRRQRTGQEPPPRYQWSDTTHLVRLPKSFLAGLDVPAFSNPSAQLTPQIKEILQLTPSESAELQHSTDTFLAQVRAAQAQTMRYNAPDPDDHATGSADQERNFEVPDLSEQIAPLRAEFFDSAKTLLGSDRFDLFRKSLSDWLPVDALDRGVRTSHQIITPIAHTVSFRPPDPRTDGRLNMQIRSSDGALISHPIDTDMIDPLFLPHLQDWIAESRTIQQSQDLPTL